MAMLVERGQHVKLTLDGMGRAGEAVAMLDDKPVLVFGGIPGEEVVAEVIRERRHYIAAQVIEDATPLSPNSSGAHRCEHEHTV